MRKRFKLNRPITVYVESAAAQVGQIRRGPIDAQLQIDYLARRSSPELPYLNVYDFARFADGSDSGLFAKESLASSTSTGPTPLSPTPLNNWLTTLNTTLLAYDPDDLASTFLNISDVMSDYNAAVSDFTNFVPGKGLLSPTNATSLTLNAPTMEYFIDWALGGFKKITTSPSYASSGTTYTHDKPADIFLVPHFWSWSSRAFLYTPAGSGGYPKTTYLGYKMYKPLPRETINNTDWDSIYADRASTAGWTSGQRDYFRSIVLGNADSEFVEYDSDGIGTPYPVTTHPGTDFPSYYDSLPAGRDWTYGLSFNPPEIGLFGNGYAPGFLIAIIIKYNPSPEYYYVWASSVWTVGNSYDIGATDTYVVV